MLHVDIATVINVPYYEHNVPRYKLYAPATELWESPACICSTLPPTTLFMAALCSDIYELSCAWFVDLWGSWVAALVLAVAQTVATWRLPGSSWPRSWRGKRCLEMWVPQQIMSRWFKSRQAVNVQPPCVWTVFYPTSLIPKRKWHTSCSEHVTSVPSYIIDMLYVQRSQTHGP